MENECLGEGGERFCFKKHLWVLLNIFGLSSTKTIILLGGILKFHVRVARSCEMVILNTIFNCWIYYLNI